MGRRLVIIIVGLVILLGAVGVGIYFYDPSLLGLAGEDEEAGEGEDAQEQAQTPTPEPEQPVVVADVDLEAGTFISDTGVFVTQQRPMSEVSSDAVTNLADIQDMVLTRDLQFDDVLLESDLREAGLSQRIPEADDPDEPRPKAYALEVDSLRGVADQIVEGDFVDIVATYQMDRFVRVTPTRIETLNYRTTKTIVQRAEVLRIVRPPSEEEAGPPADGAAAPEPGSDVEGGQQETQIDPETGRPIPPGEEEEALGAETITTGRWIVVLALTNQEAEAMEFTQATVHDAAPLTPDIALVLRGSNDEEIETTLGATMNIMVEDFEVPVPGPPGIVFPDAQ